METIQEQLTRLKAEGGQGGSVGQKPRKKREKAIKVIPLRKPKKIFPDMFLKAQKQAVERGKTWLLTRDEYYHLVDHLCFYCDDTLGISGLRLDRIDNDGGYEVDNVVPCCYRCNMVRGRWLTVDLMLKVGKVLKADRFVTLGENDVSDVLGGE